ncbi:MAG TPA: T9SS type A sorting domain-containing protein [Ohtaekwangia sp.]|uniref:T9SS type A sorting domain-containing protein n=1 Tax=Ohtaekwangia sp. TaxID=2066019 RepID=UPI002F92C381
MKRKYLLVLFLVSGAPLLAQNPQGFFLDDFETKSIASPEYESFDKPAKASTCIISVNHTSVVAPVSKYIYGNNANIFMTQMVDQPALINNIKTLSPNLIRFPGGNLSSVYFWNAATKNDLSIDVPEFLLDANGTAGDSYPYWYGGNTAGWTMSLDNYYNMLGMTNSTGIITVNYAYARYSKDMYPVAMAAHLAADWVRYDNGRTKFWEIGNESNGTWQAGYRIKVSDNHDGQPEIITGALYGEHFKIFADSMRAAAAEVGATIYIGAQLLQEEPASWATATDKSWNSGVFQKAANTPDFYIIHSYYTPYQTNSTAAAIFSSANTVTTDMMNYVTNAMTTAGVTKKPVALTEWNIFAEGSKQQVSFINGMHAALVLGELIKNNYGEASRWDLANAWSDGNDHGMFSQGDEPDNSTKWNPRPVFYYMYYFQKYFGNYMVQSSVSGSGSSDVVSYASKFDSGQSGIVVINKGTSEQTVSINLQNFGYGDRYYIYTLTGGTDNGEFSRKVYVNGAGTSLASGGPANVTAIKAKAAAIGSGVKFTAPARSVCYVLVESGDNTITSVASKENNAVKVYPNPALNAFTLELPTAGYSAINITDVQGKRVMEDRLDPSQKSFQVRTSLHPGLYFINLTSTRDTLHARVMIK